MLNVARSHFDSDAPHHVLLTITSAPPLYRGATTFNDGRIGGRSSSNRQPLEPYLKETCRGQSPCALQAASVHQSWH